NPPCSHVGPCTRKNNCPCAMNRAHCTRVCRCHLQCACTRRWTGCKCAPGEDGHACGDKRACPCHLASRECDPELCLGCASRDHTLGRCKNSQIQHNKRKKTILRKSQFGTGVFAAERILAGELICEYVGDLVYDETTRSRELLAIHRRSNYLFGLNPQFGIDAVHAGNEARFVNHREHDNVAAYIKLVNGEPRIGLFANRTIKPGAELFIDYGKDFF
ncbi:SET domain-containing protein, partial [Schizophyllum commune Tattone D]